jgi:hypothetical protein
MDSAGSGEGHLAGCRECGDKPSGSGATELVSWLVSYTMTLPFPVWTRLCLPHFCLDNIGSRRTRQLRDLEG